MRIYRCEIKERGGREGGRGGEEEERVEINKITIDQTFHIIADDDVDRKR